MQVSSTVPPPTPHQRLSQGGVLPLININTSDLSKSPPGSSQNQWHHMVSGDASTSESWNEYSNDPNLARYLQLGRRHTLGAAHNHMLMPPKDLGHLCESTEYSSQTSTDICPENTSTLIQGSLQSALTGGPVETQTVSTGNSPLSRAALLQPQSRSRSTGRRASDGGPYAAVFRLYLEKRVPQLAQINSRGSLRDSTTLPSSSVKQLLQEKKPQETPSGKPPAQSKEWLHYKDQVYAYIICYILPMFI